ncbi:unnamed protein product, partial [marine sediment metagenome]
MEGSSIPTGSRLSAHVALLNAAVSLPAFAVIIVYVHTLLDFSPSEWTGFAWAVLAHVVVIGGVSEPLRRRALAPVLRYLDARAAKGSAPELSRDAFAAVIRLPQWFQRMMMCLWMVAALSLPVFMHIAGYAGWGLGYRSVVLLVAGMTGALISSVVLFFLLKRDLSPIRDDLARVIDDPEERRSLVTTLSLSSKVQVVTVSLVVASLVFSMTLAYAKTSMTVDTLAAEWELRMLAAIEERLSAAESSSSGGAAGARTPAPGDLAEGLGQVLATLVPDPDLLPYPARFELLDPARLEHLEAGEMRDLVEAVERGVREGSSSKGHQEAVWAWKVLPDERLLVASIPREALRSSLAGLRLVLGIVI